MNFITLKTFDSSISAHILKSHLEDHGIKAYIFDDNMMTLHPMLGVAIGGIKLKVDEVDIVEAKRILFDIESQPHTNDKDEIIHCPKCNSELLYSDFISFKSKKGFISAIVSIFLWVYPLYYNRVYKCKFCNHEFNVKK